MSNLEETFLVEITNGADTHYLRKYGVGHKLEVYEYDADIGGYELVQDGSIIFKDECKRVDE